MDKAFNSLKLDKVLEHDTDQLRVELGDTVDSMRADNSEPSHSDVLRRALCMQTMH